MILGRILLLKNSTSGIVALEGRRDEIVILGYRDWTYRQNSTQIDWPWMKELMEKSQSFFREGREDRQKIREKSLVKDQQNLDSA